VIDFGNPENLVGINPTGQAGYFFDRHYQNQTQLYLAGEYRKQRMNREDILANKTSRLIFRP
jgi:penicillin amidase